MSSGRSPRADEAEYSPVTIREARLTDLDHIVQIETVCFPQETAFPRGMFAFLIKNAVTIVACDPVSMPIGFIIGYPSGRIGIIYTLDVLPQRRHKGVGRALLAEMEERLRIQGVTRCRLEAAIANPEALDLYHRSGYVEGEIIRDYYGSGNDAIRMWKNLIKANMI